MVQHLQGRTDGGSGMGSRDGRNWVTVRLAPLSCLDRLHGQGEGPCLQGRD